MKARPVLMVAVAATALAVFLTACGGDSDGSGSDPAALAPAKSPLYVEATLRPEGETKTNVEALAQRIAGVDDLGELIVSELESSATDSGEELDFEQEVEPWLGEKGGVFFREFDGEDFHRYGIAVQTSDAEATQAFVDKQNEQSDDPVRDGSYEGIDYAIESDDGTTVGVIDDFLAIAEDEATFKAMVDTADGGESLAADDRFTETFDAASEGSFADVYVDVGGLLDQSGDSVDPEAQQFLDSAGIDPAEATAVASLIPGSDQVEIELSSDLAGQNPPSGDPSGLLGELPADSVAAVALTDFGDRVGEALDQIDANGIEGVPPRKFKSTLKEAGIDVDKIAGSIGNLGVFAEGSSERDLAGAAVLETSNAEEAQDAVASVGVFLRAAGTAGVTAIDGKFSGFSVRDQEELGDQPLVVGAKGERIAIAYGLPAAMRALNPSSSNTLADSPLYKEAAGALGGTPISGFATGPEALDVVASLVAGSDDEEGFDDARPYLEKITWLAIGSTSSGDLATAKLIAGIAE
ncbi:MAG TPA: DUF3352 domain-containing protein [Solirubrobacterales bacterium]|nr:DUF3352 domain-containing protein [Solirubrobacterales bacterium]